MGRIRVLPPQVAGQIAAGEVVERPASAVKELVENALDAGARRIEIDLEGGGRELVAVSDDGEGMAPEDTPVAFRRHATSKIGDLADLDRLTTLGFRGEALPSLAAVAHVTLTTRRPSDEAACRVLVDAEADPRPEVCGAPPGTRVEVRDLFHSMPARRKALRSASAELSACIETVGALALVRPEVAFTLRQGGRTVLHTHGTGAVEDAILRLWGEDLARSLLKVHGVDGGYALAGVVARPAAAHANRGRQVFAVNGRPVRSELIRGSLEAAFRGLLMVHRYPAAVLQLRCDPALVDVNVHPAKLEVRFAEDDAVRRLVYHAVQAALRVTPLVPELTVPQAAPGEREPGEHERPTQLSFEAREPAEPYRNRFPALRPIGQVAATYILAEGPDGLYILDQHAAHERVFFEQFAADGVEVRALQLPLPLHLDAGEWARWQRWQDAVREAGFEADELGEGTLLVRAAPPGITLSDLLDRLETDPAPGNETPSGCARRALAACKAAIKANQTLAREELQALLAELAAAREPFTCPHGRPTLLRLSVADLERHFRRV